MVGILYWEKVNTPIFSQYEDQDQIQSSAMLHLSKTFLLKKIKAVAFLNTLAG